VTEPSYQPHYRLIEQALRERIASLRPGDRLPSDTDLCEEFGVSRMTARNAMERLATDGLIRREPGRGSFVTAPPAHRRANRLMTFSQEMRRAGRTPSSRLLTRVIRPSTPDDAASLEIPARQPVVHLKRLRMADDEPIALESTVLIRACADAGIDVRVVPGPSAAIAALVVSGLPADRFVFEGFLPRRRAERLRRLEQSVTDPRTLVVFESPRRVASLLRDVVEVLGDRPVAMCRELTKLHEEVVRGPASEVLARVVDVQPKGEVVIVLGGATSRSGDLASAVDEARELVSSGARPREAAREAAARHAVSANDVYRALLLVSRTAH